MKPPSIESLKSLGSESALLDTPPEAFAEWWKELGAYATRFLGSVAEAPAFHAIKPVDSGSDAPPDSPQAFGDVLAEYDRTALGNGITPTSGRFFGYIPGGGIPAAAVGDFVAALTNPYSGAYNACPGAVDIENQVVELAARSARAFPRRAGELCKAAGRSRR